MSAEHWPPIDLKFSWEWMREFIDPTQPLPHRLNRRQLLWGFSFIHECRTFRAARQRLYESRDLAFLQYCLRIPCSVIAVWPVVPVHQRLQVQGMFFDYLTWNYVGKPAFKQYYAEPAIDAAGPSVMME